ncbi:FecCD family ABC transporter permease [Gordonia hydrophobica]|uniref:Iron chelate uptake ABC transporter family permease subunit n=1 Tax=Gordonia hydrophobica TaxID=40516 RepID=A0ABZ2U008_9ACTN|nr:iron chelate uptake ABC transporter family permease subunit [Gordonia hydrophobica]MBM7369400.1 iron complex transport system permease protein [Gordonia hydrophobica]
MTDRTRLGIRILKAPEHALTSDDRVLVGSGRRWSHRYSRRTLTVVVVLTAALVGLFIASLLLGDFTVTVPDLVNTLAGRPPSRLAEFFVMERRMPRALVAMTVGAALAVAGAIFQNLTRNPLASPDILGVSNGASVGAVIVLVVLRGSLEQAAVGAAIGAIAAAALIMVLTIRTGLHGVQLVLVGVAVAAIGTAIVDYILTQVFVASAVTAQTWLIGSLQGATWSDLAPVGLVLMLVTAVLVAVGPGTRIADLGDATATSLGVSITRQRWVLVTAATVLVAAGVAVGGPIAFVALVAPHIARSLCRQSSFVASALTGAVLLASADLIALYAFGVPIPVGAVTISVGGAFFLWILVREGGRRG